MDTPPSSIESIYTSELIGSGAQFVADNDSIFVLIKDTWLDVLCLEDVGVDDDFLSVGGESITAVRVVNRVNEALNIAVPVKGLYENSTLGRFHQYVLSFVSEVESGSI